MQPAITCEFVQRLGHSYVLVGSEGASPTSIHVCNVIELDVFRKGMVKK